MIPQMLIVFAAVLVLAGLAGIAMGAPTWALGAGLGATLIESGTISFVGGLVLFALALVLRALDELIERIDLLSAGAPRGEALAPPPELLPPHAEMAEPHDHPEPEPQRRESALVTALDQHLRDGPLPPTADGRGRDLPMPREDVRRRPAAEERRRERPAPPPEERRREAPPAEERRRPARPPGDPAAAAVVRSGIIGGMAYTLYSDGSIEAELPIGTVRFGSVAELQEHVNRTGAEADSEFSER